MVKVEGMERLIAKFKHMKAGLPTQKESAATGYTQRYAIYVHEDPIADHAEGKTWKYLELPARQLSGEIALIVVRVYKKTKSLAQALLMGCLRLQRASQEIVPIDTSALKNSAWTALEKDIPTVSAAAFSKSESIRAAGLDQKREDKNEAARMRRYSKSVARMQARKAAFRESKKPKDGN